LTLAKKDKQDAYATLGDAPFSSHEIAQQQRSIGFQPWPEGLCNLDVSNLWPEVAKKA
jgi:hypothetical protein